MNTEPQQTLFKLRDFGWLVLGTGLVLLVPLIAMQFTDEVNWDRMDFIVMASLLLITGSLFLLVSRKLTRKKRIFVGAGFVLAFLYIWAELAVGIFTNLGS